MMTTVVMTAAGVMALALISVLANGQTPAPGLNHFYKSGLSFNYPADGKLEDKTETEGQHLVLTCAGSSNSYFGLRLTFPDGWEVEGIKLG